MHFFFGQRGKTFHWLSRYVFFESVLPVYIRLKHFLPTKVQPECWFKTCYPLPAVDVFLCHLTTYLFDNLIISFSRSFQSFEVFSRNFSCAPSKYGARKAASHQWHCITSTLCFLWHIVVSQKGSGYPDVDCCTCKHHLANKVVQHYPQTNWNKFIAEKYLGIDFCHF